MKNERIKVEILSWLIIVLCSAFLFSCGSRKKEISKSEDKLKIENSTAVNQTSNASGVENLEKLESTGSKTETQTSERQENLSAIDPTKPMIKKETVEGNTKTTTWENANVGNSSREEKKQESQTSEKLETVGKRWNSSENLEIKSDELIESEATSSELNVERKQQVGWYLLWMILLILVLIANEKFGLFNRLKKFFSNESKS